MLGAYRDEPVPEGFAERVLRASGAREGAGAAGAAHTDARPALRLLPGGRARFAAMAAAVLLAVGVGGFAVRRLFPAHEPAHATASAIDEIPAALLESEDIADLASYTDDEFEALLTADDAFLRTRGG